MNVSRPRTSITERIVRSVISLLKGRERNILEKKKIEVILVQDTFSEGGHKIKNKIKFEISQTGTWLNRYRQPRNVTQFFFLLDTRRRSK